MNDIYNSKYKSYKKKYLLFKKFKQEGGYLKFIGSGTSGCLICPPIKPKIIKSTPTITNNRYQISNFSFDNKEYTSCNYVGKILPIKDQKSAVDSYEEELEQLLKIKNLDPNGEYTPQLIYGNIHSTNELFSIFDKNHLAFQIKKCVEKKIKSDYYGYIISKNTGESLESKYNYIEPDTDISKLKNFLEKFNELLKFIKILYDNNYLHLDIKMNNITTKKEEDNKLYLIDFGRTKEMITYADYHDTIYAYLSQQYIMYPFEPKIYIKLFKHYTNKNLTKVSFQDIIKLIKKKNFETSIYPYSFKGEDINNKQLRQILVEVFKNDNLKHIDIDNYILERQKKYFIDYLENCEQKYFKEKFFNEYKNEYLEENKENFLNIIKDNFLNLSKEDFLINHKDNLLSKDSDIYWEKNKDKYWETIKDDIWIIYTESNIKEEYEKDFWKLYKTDFWEKYEDEYLEIYIDKYEKEEIETEFLLNYIFNPIIKKFDMYCMGIVLAEVVLLKYEISNYNVLHRFEKLIQSILFNQFDDVNDIITEINKLNNLLI
jgi:hypothetical protein